jgi:flagellar motility protein MotE (MotC chaperone)
MKWLFYVIHGNKGEKRRMKEKIMEKLGSIFYLCLFPLLFFAILGGVCVYFFKIPVQNLGTNIPLVSSRITESNQASAISKDSEEEWKEQLRHAELEISEKDKQIEDLNSKLVNTQKALGDLEMNHVELLKQVETKNNEQFHQKMDEVAELYETMLPYKAAGIFQEMPLEEAAQIILFIDQEVQSSILGKMKDTKKAGQITMIMKEIIDLAEYNETELKEKVNQLATEKIKEID